MKLIILLAFILPLFSESIAAYSLENMIKDQIIIEQNEQLEDIELVYSQDKNYILAQVEWGNDWWEEIKVGRIKNKNINWLRINNLPSEQAILSGRFVNLKNFVNPVVEIYGLTHVGHGFLYIYEIKNDELNLLFKIVAVDYNPDIRWAPDNFEKYGYGNCGEIFSGGKLLNEYKDVNKDGFLDIILSGTQEIFCENGGGSGEIYELKVSSIPVEKFFLWNDDEHVWNNDAYLPQV